MGQVDTPASADGHNGVVVEGVTKSFGSGRDRNLVLEGMSLTIARGEFVSLIGPSGCGKSTLLMIVGGLLAPSAGRVEFHGPPGARPSTAMVFQDFALFPWRTVLHNVAFGLEVRGVPLRDRLQRARELIHAVGLGGFEERYPRELSGGMRQRAGMARAFAVDPAVLLMDEPLSALDAQTRDLMQDELLRLCERQGRTVLYVTHNIHEAAYLADRIVLLSRRPGRVRAVLPVPLPRPRDESMQASPPFVGFTREIWAMVKDEARAAMAEQEA